MEIYRPSRPPINPTIEQLAEWLVREFQSIQLALDTVNDFNPVTRFVDEAGNSLKERDGMLRYIPDNSLDLIGEPPAPRFPSNGFNFFDGTQWQPLADKRWVIENFTVPGYGGLGLISAAPGDPLGAGWDRLTEFDRVTFAQPDAVIQDLVTSSLTLEETGVWVATLFINMAHNESNSGRETNYRLVNATTGVPIINPVLVPIARNQPGTVISVSFLFDADESIAGIPIAIELGGGDSITSIVYDGLEFSFHHVSAYKSGPVY